jgi:signal transduction histidine kinase
VLRYHGERLEIIVRNAAPPPGHRPATAPGRPGLGVRGMRERAELYGGSLAAGPCQDGGFLVTAVLPYGAEVPR